MTCPDRWQHLPRICLALLSLFACLFAGEAHGLVLAHEGQTDYHIYIGASATPAERHAAEELAAFLKQATGATFPLVDKREQATGPLLVVGVNDLTKESLSARPESGLLGDDGFEIRTRGDHLFVFGGLPRGTLYGVYFFLDKYLGCRWYSSDFSVIPTVKSVRLGKIDERQVPRFSYREVFSRDADDPVFSARNCLNGQFGHRLDRFLKDAHGGAVSIRGNNIFELVEPAKYRQGHPEYFGGGQLRFGKPKVRAIARIDPGTGAATDLALRMGVYPGVQRQVHVAEATAAYKLFELPGTWRQDKARAIWVAPPGSGAIEALYADRIIAIRQ